VDKQGLEEKELAMSAERRGVVDLSRHSSRSMRRYRNRVKFLWLRAALAAARAHKVDTRQAWDRSYRFASDARVYERKERA
jgi:hypothetical protein